jgi:hypothetical protein
MLVMLLPIDVIMLELVSMQRLPRAGVSIMACLAW